MQTPQQVERRRETRFRSTLLTCALLSAGCAASHSTEAVATTAAIGTASATSEAQARAEIEAALARGIEATRVQDIDAYMELIPTDLVLLDESGEVLDRERLRADVLRDWSIIPETIALSTTVDSIEVDGDRATVYTSQHWERLMLQRDGATADTVLTTQKHREIWRKTSQGWFAYEIEELGGEVFVNGAPYDPGD